jgi:transposase
VGSRVELLEQIRRDRDRDGLSIRALAEKHGVHRRAVRQALESSIPPAKRRPQSRPAPKLGEYRELIDGWLIADLTAPRKQRHTAKRIWQRLMDEHGVAEVTVRQHVHKRRRELGLTVGQVFVPQIHAPAQTAEVDWGQAEVQLAGTAVTVHVFVMRSCFSGAAFSMASPVETQQAFLEGHALAFDWFGGVFEEVRYDNLGSAVKKVLRGRRRIETDRFIAMRSHYLFDAIFTTPGIEGAHEKGGVEGEVGRFRRNHLGPVPSFGSIARSGRAGRTASNFYELLDNLRVPPATPGTPPLVIVAVIAAAARSLPCDGPRVARRCQRRLHRPRRGRVAHRCPRLALGGSEAARSLTVVVPPNVGHTPDFGHGRGDISREATASTGTSPPGLPCSEAVARPSWLPGRISSSLARGPRETVFAWVGHGYRGPV